MHPTMFLGNHELRVTTSIGIGINLNGELDADELLRTADLSMYVTKQRRRSDIV